MNTQTVSPATGAKLAAAGFQQPSPAPGQWWGDDDGVVFVFGETDDNYTPVIHVVGYGRPWVDDYFDATDVRGLVFLPTVGDILAEIGPGSCVGLFNIASHAFAAEEIGWLCIVKQSREYMGNSAIDAAAVAWLSIHEKK